MKKININFIRKAPLKGHVARVSYSIKTKNGSGATQTAITSKFVFSSDSELVIPVFDIENIASKITLKLIKPNRRLLLSKSYNPKDFVKLDHAVIEIGTKGAFKTKLNK
jgi:hypothetical protein